MCDYSLQHVTSIPAKVGDRLVTTEFANSVTRGFSPIGSPDVAVCVRPGTELAFDGDILCDRPIGYSLFHRKIAPGVAIFRQVNVDQPYAHHDALEFPDGRSVMVTDLAPGQKAVVLQLPVSERTGDRRADLHREPAAPELTVG